MPPALAARVATPVVFLAARLNRATDEAVRRDLTALPGLVDRVDELIAEGVIGRPERNLADYQIATSVALLLGMDDVRPLIEGRPAAAHARAVVVRYPGRLPPRASRRLASRLRGQTRRGSCVPSGRTPTVRLNPHGSCNPPQAPARQDRR